MDQKRKIITEEEFKKILLYKEINDLLLINIACYPLSYYFARMLITSGLFVKRSESQLNESTNIKILFRDFVFIFKSLCKNIRNTQKDLDILFISKNRFFDLKMFNNTQFMSDYLFGNVINYTKKKHPEYNISFISTYFEDMPKLKDITLHSLADYSTFTLFIQSFLQSVDVYVRWRLSNTSIISYLTKNNLSYIIPLFTYFFSFKALFFNIYSDYCLQKALKVTRTKIILANDDVMSFKPLVNFETQLILMQSASLDLNKELFLKMFISNFSSEIQKPDLFLVTGQKYYDIKQNTNDSKQIIVVGQPRYDMLYYICKIYKKETFIKNYKINPHHKIILWATQCHDMSDEENIINMKAIFGCIENLENITLIIKQHPEEGIAYTKMISDYLRKYSINAIITSTDSDVYEQLYICDLMITKNSTTAVEALSLNKPVIVLNLTKESDVMDYVKTGVALGVYKEEDLKISVERLLKNDADIAKNRLSYIYQSLYKIDGRSSERIVEIIEDIIAEWENKKL
jgi:CDP-glycerol glycerophosphotransferase (TagB/SpsB family)